MEFPLGEFAEGMPWHIRTDIIYNMSYTKPCKHCIDLGMISDRTFPEKMMHGFKVPRVVSASNEGGYNGTDVCVDCILEAVKV